MKSLPGALAWCLWVVLALPAAAQELEPRAYSNLPVDLNFLIVGYGNLDGAVLTDPSAPLRDGHVEMHALLLAYARSFGFLGKSGKIDVFVPYGWADGTAKFMGQPRERTVDGFGDPRLRLSLNLYGAPAMSLEQFSTYEPDLVVGASLQVIAPLGQYDDDKLLNLGTNRWTVKPEIGFSKTWKPFTIELSSSFAVFTDNDDFLGGKRFEQEPIYNLQSHLVYGLRWGIWGALDLNYYGGGVATTDNVASNDGLSNVRIGGTLSFPLSRYVSVKIFGSTGVAATAGTDFDTLGVLGQVRWGAGL